MLAVISGVMFLNLMHQKLEVYKTTKELIVETYRITQKLPESERYGISSQMRRAATSAHFNTSEGCSRKSKNERARFFEIARGSVVELDTAAGTALELNFITNDDLARCGDLIMTSFKLISGMINEIDIIK
jgi:four helix bundle protein